MQGEQNLSEAGKSLANIRDRWLVRYQGSLVSDILHFVPAVSALNGWIGGKATDIQIRRLSDFLQELDQRLDDVAACALTEEELHDLSIWAFDAATMSRGQDKLKYMAEALSQGVKGEVLADEAEIALKILSDLGEVEIKILIVALKKTRNPQDEQHQYLPFYADGGFSTSVEGAYYLGSALSGPTDNVLIASTSNLFAKGLLVDDGAGRLSGAANQLWKPSPLAVWLVGIVAS